MGLSKLQRRDVLLEELKRSTLDLLQYVEVANQEGGIGIVSRMIEHAICDCINRIGDGANRLGKCFYTEKTKREWTGVRVITAHRYEVLDLTQIWSGLPGDAERFLKETEGLLSQFHSYD